MKILLLYNKYNYAQMESYKPELYINLVCKEFIFNYYFLNYCILCVLASVVLISCFGVIVQG